MASKTTILELGIFRIGSEKSIHGKSSLELASYQSWSSQIISLSGRRTYLARAVSNNELESVE